MYCYAHVHRVGYCWFVVILAAVVSGYLVRWSGVGLHFRPWFFAGTMMAFCYANYRRRGRLHLASLGFRMAMFGTVVAVLAMQLLTGAKDTVLFIVLFLLIVAVLVLLAGLRSPQQRRMWTIRRRSASMMLLAVAALVLSSSMIPSCSCGTRIAAAISSVACGVLVLGIGGFQPKHRLEDTCSWQ